MSKFAVIIPFFNEESGADQCIKVVLQSLKRLPYESVLIAVNDGSVDKTPQILMRYTKNTHFYFVNQKQNQGYGAALQRGVSAAKKLKSEFCIFMDSDLTNNPEYLEAFMRAGSPIVDCVKASRYIDGGGMLGVPRFRRVSSMIGNAICRLCFSLRLHDYTNGFRMVRTSLLSQIPYQERGFAIIMEEMYWLQQHAARCVEIPSILTARPLAVDSKFVYTPNTIWSYGKYAIQAAAHRWLYRGERQ